MRVGMKASQLREHLDGVSAHLAEADQRGLKTVAIIDLSQAPRATGEQRRIQAEWRGREEAVLKRVSLGQVFVVPNRFIRGSLVAMLWLRPPPNGHTITHDMNEAIDWAIARLQSHGVAVPERLVHDRARVLRELGLESTVPRQASRVL
jgi:hypothetical protein